MGRATELPLTFDRGEFYTPAILNGHTMEMLVDTGSEGTALTRAATKRLAIGTSLSGEVQGIGGIRESFDFYAQTFQIGTLHGTNLRLHATVMDLTHGDAEADGLLGDDFLAAYDIDLDVREHKAILFSALKGCHSPAAALDGDLFATPMVVLGREDPRPMIKVTIDGKDLTALIDSGASHTGIFRNAARRLGLVLADLKSDPHYRVGGIGPRAPEVVRHVMAPVTVGDLTVRNMPVEIIDQHTMDEADMLLGLDFLTRVHVWLSFSSRTVIMQYPSRPSPAPV